MEYVTRTNPRPAYFSELEAIGNIDYIPSGLNNIGDMHGMFNVGHAWVGTTVVEMSGPTRGLRHSQLDYIKSLANKDVRVFLDSGAFREVDRDLQTVKEITDEEWHRRVDIYFEAAEVLGPSLAVVVPDRIGDQGETLRRQAVTKEALRAIWETGAELFVPLPPGELEPAHQLLATATILDVPVADLVPAFPTVKGPYDPEMIADFAFENQPERLHLLGLGPKNRAFDAYVQPIKEAAPETYLTIDSAPMQALSKPGTDFVSQREVVQDWLKPWMGGDVPGTALDYTEDFYYPSRWMPPSARERFAAYLEQTEPGMIPADREEIVTGDIDGWVQDMDSVGSVPVRFALETAWQELILPTGGGIMGRAEGAATDIRRQRQVELALGPRIIVITSCTASKMAQSWPAEYLYTGRQHLALMEGVEQARAAGLRVDVYIVSAGLGLISGKTVCDPYDESFTGKSKAAIQRQAGELGIPDDVHELLASDYDLGLMLLGRDYLEAVGLTEQTYVTAPLFVVVGARQKLPEPPNIERVELDAQTVKSLGGQIEAKGRWAKAVLDDLAERNVEFIRGR